MKNIFRKLVYLTRDFIYMSYYLCLRIMPITKNKVVIVNYYGKGYGDNAKYIVNELIKDNTVEIVWLVKKDLIDGSNEFPPNVRLVAYNSLKGHYELATAKIWLDNSRKPWFILKRKNQYYIQLWHGSPALKKIEADAENKLSDIYVRDAKHDSNKVNLFISNCKWFSEKIPKTFWYDGPIEEIGLPRNDVFFKEENFEQKINNHFNLEQKCKTLLYAPTFRNSGDLNAYNIDLNKLVNQLQITTGETWRIFVRLHPNISNKANLIQYNDKICNASNYSDLQELLCYCDTLITDYSSLMFDYSLTKRPIFLYCNDYEAYKEERGIYFELNELPFIVSYNLNDLYTNIANFDNGSYQRRLKEFSDQVGMVLEGDSSKKIAQIINKIVCK